VIARQACLKQHCISNAAGSQMRVAGIHARMHAAHHEGAAMSKHAPNPPRRSSRCREAYLRCLPELRALALGDLCEPEVALDDAVFTVLTMLPQVRICRPLMTQLPGVDMRAVDNVESYALALAYTHFRFVTSEGSDLADLIELAQQQRTELCDAAAALPARARGGDSTPHPPQDLAHDLIWRAELAREYLYEVLPEQKALRSTLEVVVESELVAEELLASLAADEEQLPPDQLLEECTRAFTLFKQSYEGNVRPAMLALSSRKADLDAMALAYAFEKVAEQLGPEAVSLLGSERGPFGEN
jgi:hypothetical protein